MSVRPSTPPEVYAARRAQVLAALGPDQAMLVFGNPEQVRSRDTDYGYRPSSDLFYLTGFSEPGTCLLLRPSQDQAQSVLFLRPRDPERETWDGRRLGVEAAPATLGVDAAFPIGELEAQLKPCLGGIERLHYAFGAYPEQDAKVMAWIPRLGSRDVSAPTELVHAGVLLHEMRLRKDPSEVAWMRHAAAITTQAYAEAVQAIRPGGNECEVQAALEGAYKRLGGNGSAYHPIVAGGVNACILHYNENDQALEAGSLLLIDSGAEAGWYACDVSRTYPVGGRFSPAQREVYGWVLKAQKAACDAVRPGQHVKAYHEVAVRVLTEGLVAMGVLAGEVEALIQAEAHKPFYMHGTGHFLGLDTHDVGRYKRRNSEPWRSLEPGMVLTVEPGLYFTPGLPGVPERLAGIGVRIEDDLLVTEDGHENLTEGIPKEIDEVEALFAPALASAGA